MLTPINQIRRDVNRAMRHIQAIDALRSLKTEGFGYVPGSTVLDLLRSAAGGVPDISSFKATWNGMGRDGHMADGGKYRERSFATFLNTYPGGRLERTEHRPHFQKTDFNPLNGGIDRLFDPTPENLAEGPVMRALMEAFRAVCEAQSPCRYWKLELHQFRINTSPAETGKPTPEGIHRDGVDFAMVMLVARENVRGGRTTVVSPEGVPLLRATMRQRFSTLLLADNRVLHGVSAIVQADPGRPAYRDTLVITMKRLDQAGASRSPAP